MDGEGYSRAEEAVRLLAAAVGAARLYPPTSDIPREAIARFSKRANDLTAHGPIRLIVDPEGFRAGDEPLATGHGQVSGLAELLHAMQVGQLLIVPGVTPPEVEAFVKLVLADPAQVRAGGGFRSALATLGIRHLAAIEVSLRAAENEGLAGLDLVSAPLDQIAERFAAAVERRGTAPSSSSVDEVAQALEGLEEAMRDLAIERMAAAMMRLDEATRKRVLAYALTADQHGRRMEGALSVIARMRPAALARLLRLVASEARIDPRRIAAALTLPPETAKLLGMMLTPRPQLEPELAPSATEQAERMAQAMAVEEDTSDLERQLSVAAPSLASGRALATATAVSRRHADHETVRTIGELLPRAARDGAFVTVREALRRLDEIAADPSLAEDVAAARQALADPAVLADVCRAPLTDADAAIAGEILTAAGPMGAEVLLEAYTRLAEPRRSLLRPVLRGMSESVLGVARQQLRTADAASAAAIIQALTHLGDRRAVPVIANALDHLEEQVRFAAATALARMRVPEAVPPLLRAIWHREPETQRHVVREVGNARIAEAVPVLARALLDINVFKRTYETRKEIITALERIGTPEAERVLRRYAQQPFALGRKTRELRNRAAKAAQELAKTRGVT